MNKNFSLTLFAVASIAMFGCKKDNNTSSNSGKYYMNCTVNGTAVNLTNCAGNQFPGGGVTWELDGFNGTISGGSPALNFSIVNYNQQPGTFTFDSTSSTIFAIYYPAIGVPKNTKSGSFTISTVTPEFTGTFNFTCKDGTIITGSFVGSE